MSCQCREVVILKVMKPPKLFCHSLVWGLIIITTGCVAPIPVSKKWNKAVWKSPETNGSSLSIEERGSYTTLPVWGPEGPDMMQVGSVKVRYFLVHSKTAKELGFLRCNSKEGGMWGHFRQINNEPTWLAIRLNGSFLADINSGELIVFDEKHVHHNRRVNIKMGPSEWYARDFWQRLKYEPAAASIVYESSDGSHRYEFLTDVDRRINE